MYSEMIKKNTTEEKREKFLKILKKQVKKEDNILLVHDKYENKNQIMKDINENLGFQYLIKNNSKIDTNIILDYLNKFLMKDLDYFLRQKEYNVSKNPLYKVSLNNDKIIKIDMMNFLEIDNLKSFMSNKMIEQFETYLIDKLDLMFDMNIKQVNKFKSSTSTASVSNKYETSMSM